MLEIVGAPSLAMPGICELVETPNWYTLDRCSLADVVWPIPQNREVSMRITPDSSYWASYDLHLAHVSLPQWVISLEIMGHPAPGLTELRLITKNTGVVRGDATVNVTLRGSPDIASATCSIEVSLDAGAMDTHSLQAVALGNANLTAQLRAHSPTFWGGVTSGSLSWVGTNPWGPPPALRCS
jgi:hypothetical protein